MNQQYQDNNPSTTSSFVPDDLPVNPRRQRRRVMTERAPAPQDTPTVSVADDAFQPPEPARSAAPKPTPKPEHTHTQRKTETRQKPTTHTGPGFFTRLKNDKRPAIFTGIVCLVASIYLIVAFFSFFFSSGAADQSIIHTGGLDGAVAATESVVNAAGPLGAWLSESLISNGMGLGALVIPYYLAVLGLSLVGLSHCNFWTLTAKAILTMISLSIVVGMVTYDMTTSFYWGGRHGHDVNMFLKQTTGVWGMIGVSIILVASVAMIFLKQLTDIFTAITRMIARRRQAAAERREARENARKAREAKKEAADARTSEATQDEADEETPVAEHPEESVPEPVAFEGNEAPDMPDPLENLGYEEASESYQGNVPEPEETESEPERNEPESEPAQTQPTASRSVEATVALHSEVQPAPVSDPLADLDDNVEEEEETPGDIIVDAAPIEQASEGSENQNFFDPTAELSLFRKPSLDLLDEPPSNIAERNEQEQADNINNIRRVLSNFGIGIDRIEATVGPTVTLYEIVPAEGVRINKIRSLEDDIALSLSALGIRIIAPMPGKGTIGIEVPNKKSQIVSIRSILASKKYQESKAELPMAMGATISNDVYIADLAKMPHLLVAGSTGMGKSVGLNTIITSILYKKHPAEVKFVLIDPKMVEFSLYNRIERHYLAKLSGEEEAIITNTEKVVPTLLSLCMEMDNRYELLKKANVRSIKEYNEKFVNLRLNPTQGHRYLPYIVVVIDEFADLIMTAGKEVETPIARIAQKARAVGIHVNFPGRIAFRVTQQLESRIILDRPGANQLIGRGDMLFSRDGIIDRVQCAFIDTHEVEAICEAIGRQAGYPMAYELPEYVPPTAEGADQRGNGVSVDRDPLFEAAAREVLDQNVGSTTLLQRRFEIGYPRAGKIMDQLERAGVVGPAQGGKPRKVLMTHMDFDQWLACTGTTQYTPLNSDKAAD